MTSLSAGHEFKASVIIVLLDDLYICSEVLKLQFKILISSLDIADIIDNAFSLRRQSCKNESCSGS